MVVLDPYKLIASRDGWEKGINKYKDFNRLAMGKASEKRGESLAGATIEIEKTMAENPRRVAKFAIVLSLPPGLSENTRKICLACVDACPVHRSLHPSIAVDLRVL